MSWKCVLVGLALVLPGTLLIVEGRESENHGDASSLREYFTRRKRLASKGESDPVRDVEADENSLDSSLARVGRRNLELHAQVAKVQHGNTWGGSVKSGGSLIATTTFIMIVAGCTVLAAISIVGAGVCWYKYHKKAKAASVVDYPAYGVTGPTKDHLPSPGDRKLAQSAQMYHYQHQKQQMIAMEKANGNMKHDASDDESEEDNVEGDYTVYECPGLAPTGEMEVKNPLFRGDETPSTPVNEDPQPPQED